MNGMLRNHRILFAGLLGAAVLAGTPLFAQADQGKWWTPKQGGSNQETRNRGDGRDGHDGWNRGNARSGDRGYRGWNNGPRFQRDIVVIRDGVRSPRYRAHRIWVRPAYFRRQHLVVIRPVRYFFGADALFGGVRIHARFHNQDRFLYGCNFCDERFDNYADYRRHVLTCDDRPRGCRLDVSDWDDEWSSSAYDYDRHCNDSGPYDDNSHYGDNGRYDDNSQYYDDNDQ